MPLLEGFDLEFSFTTADKEFTAYEASYEGEINNDTIMIPVDDLLATAGVNIEEIVSFTLRDKNDRAIVTAGFVTENSNAAKINLISDSSVDSAKEETNPATGVSDIFTAGAIAAFAGTAALISKKRR